jgi:hypothetical protein
MSHPPLLLPQFTFIHSEGPFAAALAKQLADTTTRDTFIDDFRSIARRAYLALKPSTRVTMPEYLPSTLVDDILVLLGDDRLGRILFDTIAAHGHPYIIVSASERRCMPFHILAPDLQLHILTDMHPRPSLRGRLFWLAHTDPTQCLSQLRSELT